MVKCSFSGKDIKPGTGKIFVKDNGQILNFKGQKEQKNMIKLKRDSRKFKWTTFFEKGETAKVSTKKDKK